MRAVVVGAGMSGAFAARALRRWFGEGLSLVVLDREERAGGRAWRRTVHGVPVETGASVFHSANRLLVGAAEELGLAVVDAGGTGTLGIWDGIGLVFRTTGRGDGLRLLARYRGGLLAGGRGVRQLVRQLGQVYPRLEAGEAWGSPDQLWATLGLDHLLRQPADEVTGRGRFRTEFADGVARNNYAQETTRLNALVNAVSLAGAGLGGGSLYRLAEGNAAVSEGLLARAGAQLHLAATAERVIPKGPSWQVTGQGFAPLEADAVVIAAPLEGSGIQLAEVSAPPPREFVRLHVSFVSGELSAPSLTSAGTAPGFVLTTAAAGSLMSIERVAPGDAEGRELYKVFSTEPLTDSLVGRFFTATKVTRMTWSAYPCLPAGAPSPGFRLATACTTRARWSMPSPPWRRRRSPASRWPTSSTPTVRSRGGA